MNEKLILAKSVLRWWEDAQYMTHMVFDEDYMVFDDEPSFVALAKKIVRENELIEEFAETLK